jgi:hypothetical protein
VATATAGAAGIGRSGSTSATGLPAASSIARLASASAALLRSRGIHSKVTSANRPASFAASAASGRKPGFLICQRPDICSTTSFESIRTCTPVAFSSPAARSPSISPVYSATLFVVMPSDAYRSSRISPVAASRTTAPYPAGPGFPRDPPSASTMTLRSLTVPIPPCAP